jgi:hypothetical protein
MVKMAESLPDVDDPKYADVKEDVIVTLGLSYFGLYLFQRSRSTSIANKIPKLRSGSGFSRYQGSLAIVLLSHGDGR